MKRAFFVITLFAIAFLLVSCAVSYEFSQTIADPTEVTIEIVNLECEMGQHSGAQYDAQQVTVLSVIEDDQKEAFLKNFAQVKSYQPNFGSRIDSVVGKAIRITYANADVELITDYGCATVVNGVIRNQTITFDTDSFNALLEKYDAD